MALAHHRLGHTQEAQQWLDKAEQWYEQAVQGALASPTATANIFHWPDWPSFVVLRREAHKVILGKDLADDPRLKKLADRTRDWLQKRDKATLDYDMALFLEPNKPSLSLARARRLVELRRLKEAEADLAKAVELLGDKAEPTKPATSEADKLFAHLAAETLLKKLTKAIEDNPEDLAKRWQRGDWYALHRRWKEAAADFTTKLERQPPGKAYPWLHVAPVLVASGDHAGYSRFCRAMLQRFGEAQDPDTADQTGKACLLLPASGKDVDLACQLTDRAVALGKNAQWEPYFLCSKALADYRRGNARAATEELHSLLLRIASREKLGPARQEILARADLSACCHVVLAMALHQQGESKTARTHLAQAAKLLDRHVPDPARFPRWGGGLSYNHDWLIVWLLYREAQTLIEGMKAKSKK